MKKTICFVILLMCLIGFSHSVRGTQPPGTAQTFADDDGSKPFAPAEPKLQPETVLNFRPQAADSVDGATEPQVRPVPPWQMPEEGPPTKVESVRVDAEEISLAPFGVTSLLPRSTLVPEPFCNIDGAMSVPESSESASPRCVNDAHEHAPTSSESNTNRDTDSSGGNLASTNAGAVLTAVFTQPAHFATDSCQGPNACFGQPPVIIYEGMSVRLEKNGGYEVRAMVDGPRVPSILRLQLSFSNEAQDVVAVITLPPIRLIPDDRSASRLPNETQTWFVRRTGYSEMLRQWPSDQLGLSVRRTGVAQIGQIPEL